MEKLADLQPRSAGSLPVEVRTEFRQEAIATAAQMRCEYTCGCRLGTAQCVTTGNSQFLEEN